jgi:hypothetical protein
MTTQRKVLEQILASGAAMSVLDSAACAIEEARPPATDRRGALLMSDNGRAAKDPGEPAKTLGDLVREVLNVKGGRDG